MPYLFQRAAPRALARGPPRRMNPYVIPALPPDRPYSWFLTADPGKRHAALLSAVDHEGNTFACEEHFAEGLPDRLHAEAYRGMLQKWAHRIDPHVAQGAAVDVKQLQYLVDCWADPGGAGAQSILNLADCNIFAKPVVKDAGSVKASIDLIRRAAYLDPLHQNPWNGQRPAPHLYFLSTLESRWVWEGTHFCESRLLWELRRYRLKPLAPPGTPIKETDDVTDCLRYLFLVRPFTPAPADLTLAHARAQLDPLSRRAAEEYDELVKPKKPRVFQPL